MSSLDGRRVVHVAAFHGAHGGSFADAMRALALAIVARGGSFEIIVPPVAGASWYERVRSAGGIVTEMAPGPRVVRALLARTPDVVHAHFYGYVAAAAIAAMARRARFVWHVHTSTSTKRGLAGQVKDAVRWRIVRAAGGTIVTVNGALADQLRERGAPGAIVVVPNGIDVERFRPPSDAERAEARARLGIAADRRVILFFGRDPFVKGSDALLSALRGADPRTTLLGIALPDASARSFRDAVHTVTFPRYDDAQTLHWAADILALPSRFEAAPFSLMEALACGTPAVASDLPTVRETAAGSTRCAFVPVGDAAALRTALDAAPPRGAVEPALRARYSLETWVERMLALYGAAGGADSRAA